MQSQEGGIVPEEYRTEYVADRVNTLGRAFLGVSVECARCHDHKYDPVSQEEYFRLFAFFNGVNETGQIPYSGVPSPTVIVTDDEAEADARGPARSHGRARGRARPGQRRLRRRLRSSGWRGRHASAGGAGRPGGPPAPRSGRAGAARRRRTASASAPAHAALRQPGASRPTPRTWAATWTGSRRRCPAGSGARRGSPATATSAWPTRGSAFFERNQPFSLALWFRIEKEGTAGPLVTRSAGLFGGNRGYEIILHEDGRLTAGLHHVFPDNSIEIETAQPRARR